MRQPPSRISIHAPRTGSDLILPEAVKVLAIFQSTLPARGATSMIIMDGCSTCISIHAPRTGSDVLRAVHRARLAISIHAPRTGSDGGDDDSRLAHGDFNPRSPHGERPQISQMQTSRCYFNPRSPHGERRACAGEKSQNERFQPTLPARGATPSGGQHTAGAVDFNPRSPHGERHLPLLASPAGDISTHAPRTGSDTTFPPVEIVPLHFNPRSPHGERHNPRKVR